MNNILLASVNCLPKLVNGKVVVINKDGTYDLYRPSKYTTIADDYNTMNYCILIHAKYSKCIVQSTTKEQEHYLVNKQLEELNNNKKNVLYKIGDKIHIYSKRGIYEIVDIIDGYIKITCNVWKYTDNLVRIIPAEDFCCRAGGLYNAVHI